MLQRRKLLRRLQEVDLSPDEAWALLDRVQTHTSSADDRERLAHLIRVTTAVTEQRRATPADPEPSAPQRLRLRAKPSASGRWPRSPGAVNDSNMQPVKDTVVKKPAATVTLSAAEGEAMIARRAVYAPSRSDCELLIQVVRW